MERDPTHEQVLAALPLVLQHWQDRCWFVHTRLLCTLLQVSQSVNSALQQSGCRFSVKLSKPSSRKVTSFAAWLQQYGNFLHSFTADDTAIYSRIIKPATEDSVADIVLEHMFSMGLQLYCAGAGRPAQHSCRTTNSTSARTLAQAATAAGNQELAMPARRQMPLGLASLAWVSMQTPAVLQALQAAPSLTELKLTGVSTAHVTPAMLAALGGLTGLRSLTFDSNGADVLPQQIMSVVGGMQQLTRLVVGCIEPQPDSMLQLPASLCAVTVIVGPQVDAVEEVQQQQQQPLSFVHLTNLLELNVGVWSGESAGLLQLVLQANLTSLTTGNHVDVLEVPVGISDLHLFNGQQCPGFVRKLPALQDLNNFVLYFSNRPDPVVPGAWEQLRTQLRPVFSTLGCLTTLTCVEFDNQVLPADLFRLLPVGRALGQLRQLAKFSCSNMTFNETDVMHLSSLTNLTQLHVHGAGAELSDLVACIIAANCPRLQQLDFAFAGIKTQAIFGVAAKLTDMEWLDIVGNDVAVTELGLFQLTNLKKLTSLGLPEQNQVADSVMDRFLRVMPQLTYLDYS